MAGYQLPEGCALTQGPGGGRANRFAGIFHSAHRAHEAGPDELAANARVAAAAPELAESLREMLVLAMRNDIPMDVQIERAERAIALLERLGMYP